MILACSYCFVVFNVASRGKTICTFVCLKSFYHLIDVQLINVINVIAIQQRVPSKHIQSQNPGQISPDFATILHTNKCVWGRRCKNQPEHERQSLKVNYSLYAHRPLSMMH